MSSVGNSDIESLSFVLRGHSRFDNKSVKAKRELGTEI